MLLLIPIFHHKNKYLQLFFLPFSKIMTFVFSTLTLRFNLLQYIFNLSSIFCSAFEDFKKMTASSAYNKVNSGRLSMKNKSSSELGLILLTKSLMKNINKIGESFTPLFTSKDLEKLLLYLITDFTVSYIAFTAFNILVLIPPSNNLIHKKFLSMRSKALEKSTKAQYNLFPFCDAFDIIL